MSRPGARLAELLAEGDTAVLEDPRGDADASSLRDTVGVVSTDALPMGVGDPTVVGDACDVAVEPLPPMPVLPEGVSEGLCVAVASPVKL